MENRDLSFDLLQKKTRFQWLKIDEMIIKGGNNNHWITQTLKKMEGEILILDVIRRAKQFL